MTVNTRQPSEEILKFYLLGYCCTTLLHTSVKNKKHHRLWVLKNSACVPAQDDLLALQAISYSHRLSRLSRLSMFILIPWYQCHDLISNLSIIAPTQSSVKNKRKYFDLAGVTDVFSLLGPSHLFLKGSKRSS